jgi:hypothetical protein
MSGGIGQDAVNAQNSIGQGNRTSESFDECAQEIIAPASLFELHAV